MRRMIRLGNGTSIGDEVIFLDTPTSYKRGVVLKIKGLCPPGEVGNVLIAVEGSEHWILGGKIVRSVEAAEKQIAYNKKHDDTRIKNRGRTMSDL